MDPSEATAPVAPEFDPDEDQQLEDLIELEAEIEDEQQRRLKEGDEDVIEEAGGGFFVDDATETNADTVPSSGAAAADSAVAGTSTSAQSASTDPDSIAEDAPARPFAAGCRECGNIGVQQNYLIAFGVSVCFRCQQIHKARYALCTQTTAQTEYLLPLPLIQTLGFIERKNPHKQAWGAMKLYWKQQILALVRQKYGTREALESAKRERDLIRIQKDDSRRRAAHQTAARSAAFSSTLAASMNELGSQTPAEVVAMLAARTKGMAPMTAHGKEKRKKKRKSDQAIDEEDTNLVDDGDDDVQLIDSPSSKPSTKRKKSKSDATSTSSSAAAKRSQPLHTHTFQTIADGRQQCTDPKCQFTKEFETF